MHELSYVREIYRIVNRHARIHSAKRVVSVTILAGLFSGIEEDSFQFYWKHVTRKTLMDTSIVSIDYTKDEDTLLVKSIEIEANMKKIVINKPILDELTHKGGKIRKIFDSHHIFSLNIMASPGAGKTSLILKTISLLKKKYRIAVIEGDIVPIDVEKIRGLDVRVVLAHTGGSCHLDSIMIENAIKQIDLRAVDLLIVENVGNLICPAGFYLGTHKNVVVASVPEGDDKPYKYPAMFKGADVVILNKSDYLHIESFNVQNFENGVGLLNKIPIINLSCKTGENITRWIDWIEEQYGNN